MFCNKCGNSLADKARFCDKCGNPVEIQNSPSAFSRVKTKATLNVGVGFFGSVLTSLMLIFMLLLQKWIKIPALSYFVSEENSSLSLFQIFDAFEELGGISDDAKGVIYLCVVGVIIVVLSCVIAYAVHIYQSVVNKEKIRTSITASCVYIVTAIVVVLGVFIINYALKEESYGFLEHALSVSNTVYFSMFIALVNIICSAIYMNE